MTRLRLNRRWQMRFLFAILCTLLTTSTVGAQTATVSWYGSHWAGRKTANGERFNPHDFTAASKTLPMGTKLLLKKGSRSVVVRINDRGPYIKGRSLDLSWAAANHLGMIGSGVTRVNYRILKQASHGTKRRRG